MPTNEEESVCKSSMEILSELFSTFDAQPPVIVKKEKDKKVKKAKKHKHKQKVKKEKKHKKKSKKRKRNDSTSSKSTVDSDNLTSNLSQIKSESPAKKIKLENDVNVKVEKGEDTNANETIKDVVDENALSNNTTEIKETNDADFTKLFEATILEIKEKQERDKADINKEDGECSEIESIGHSSKHKHKKHKSHKKKHKHRSKSKERKRSRTPSTTHSKEKSQDYKDNNKSRDRSRSPIRSRDKSKERFRERSRSRSKQRFRDRSRSKSKDRNRDKTRSRSKERFRNSSRSKSKERFKNRSRSKSKERFRERSRSKERSRDRDKYNEFYRDYYKYKHDKIREWDLPKFKDKNFFKKLDKDLEDIRSRRHRVDDFYRKSEDREDRRNKDRYRDKNERISSSKDSDTYIDKKKLLEIARKNAIQMMKSGNLPGALNLGPQAQEKVIAAIKSGGKTIEELTDFCKTLSKQEELGNLSSISEDGTDSETEMPFHHPFQIKERPSSITMNIKNSIPLPLKSTQERATELRMQFPVSSGQQHRSNESEWVPVSPKKIENVASIPTPVAEPIAASTLPAILPPLPQTNLPPLPQGPQVFPNTSGTKHENVDIASIVSQRLTAMRKLQENPHDVQAISEMYKAEKEMNTWAESKQQIGQFTGSTGAQVLSAAQLSSGYQAWARKDQLQTAAPVSGGMGMHLLQKMGWKPGEGLGKEKTGTLEPLLLEVKLDKKGIVAKEEQKGKRLTKVQKAATVNKLNGKHPVSLLGEYATKNKLGVPQYSLCFECGPDHKKNFLFKVVLNGIEYKPNVASLSKKEAKANAATVCLQQLGILPTTQPPPT